MSKVVDIGMLRGRPFAGVMSCHFCEERFAIVRIANYLILNVYIPCTSDARHK